MKNLSRILTVILCCVPMFPCGAGPVATTAGSNLTAYNPSTAYNNQWATVSNGRYDVDVTAKVDFGNCNAVVLRCAQPKCAGGGCTDYTVAGQIVSGCVKSNSKCKQYGDDLINYMTAQLVANSNAKINEQQMALEQAKIQAEAQAAAAAAANTQNEQMIAQMQNQMAQMQNQMAQQQAESAAQLQEALAQQAAQSAAALESMKSAATEAAKENESGVTAYQQEAIERGISADVLERQKITGQIMTEIENADLKLKEVKVAMQNSFDYAKCDARGNNCSAPKRIKKWRELATGFLDPYDETIDKIYDALVTAQAVGVDLSQIYMMLNNSCNSWGQYMCQKGGTIDYDYDGKGGIGSCTGGVASDDEQSLCLTACENRLNKWKDLLVKGSSIKFDYSSCVSKCNKQICKPCTLLKVLTKDDEVYEGWINPTADENNNGTVVACASNALDSSKLFTRRTKNKNGAGLVDIDKLDTWLNQVEPDAKMQQKKTTFCGIDYNGDDKKYLETAVSSKIAPAKGAALCVDMLGAKNRTEEDKDCPYINPIFAICDTHPYNADKDSLENGNTVDTNAMEEMNEIIGLKITVVSQQMYKQYEYLRATLQRLKIQLEKSVLTANLEAAGAKDDGSSSGGLLGGNKNSQYRDCSGKSKQGALDCLRENYNTLMSQINSKKCGTKEKEQLKYDIKVIKSVMDDESKVTECGTLSDVKSCKDCLQLNYSGGLSKLDKEIRDDENSRYRYR